MMLSWHKCYKEGWGKEIVPEAYGHPAKFARGLIRRIYEHAIEQGYLREGQTVLDPFGGIALGAADALANGLHFVGVELEKPFVDMGAGCDCTGISKADWVRCFGRWKRFAHRDSRHWCPRCLAEAGKVIEPRPPTLPGMGPEPTASYERNSGQIPHTEPHYYSGNLDLFARHARDGAMAVLVQGDSRRLVEVLEGARAEGLISSPPWSSVQIHDDKNFIRIDNRPRYRGTKWEFRAVSEETASAQDGYGTSPAQLSNMPTGEPPQVDGIVASPPYAQSLTGGGEAIQPRPGDVRKYARKMTLDESYGRTDGQLAALPEGEPPQVVDMRCPYCLSLLDDSDSRGENLFCADCGTFVEYVDAWEYAEESLAAIVSSPPFGAKKQHTGGKPASLFKHLDGRTASRKLSGMPTGEGYSTNPDNLGNMELGEPPAGIVQVDACVSSPPWEQPGVNLGDVADTPGIRQEISDRSHSRNDAYGQTNGQLGNTTNDTFWSAARAILLQCHQVLAPGGVAIFVCKRFVRDKKIVEFSQQWADLCQSCGFELIEWIKAWLIEERGTQYDLEGEAHTKTIKRFSFFRRLHAQKYPHLAIDWEDVLIFRKPNGEIKEGMTQGIVASPPYSEGLGHGGKASKMELEEGYPSPQFGGYGTDPANLGNMKEGNPPT